MLETQFNNFSYFEHLVEESKQRIPLDLKSNCKPVITHSGRCWTFSTGKMVTVPGLNGGLSFVVNLQQFEYTEDTVTAGIALSLAQPGTQIVEQMTATAASPGSFVALILQQRTFVLKLGNHVFLFQRGPRASKTQFLCRDQCSNRAIAKACGCRPMGDTQPDLKSLDYCGPQDELCIHNQTSFAFENCNCSMPPYQESQFKVKSTGQGISRNFQRSIESYLTITENYFADYIVMLALNYETMAESPDLHGNFTRLNN